ncbi:hypothetical protein CR513_22001, partial [Mucuna pruriens]
MELFSDTWDVGITGPVILEGLKNGSTIDLSSQQWSYQSSISNNYKFIGGIEKLESLPQALPVESTTAFFTSSSINIFYHQAIAQIQIGT